MPPKKGLGLKWMRGNGLKWTGESADEFFATFNALAVQNPTNSQLEALHKFFFKNIRTIRKLPFSAKQVERMNKYINMISTSIMFLKGALQRAEGDADEFFAIFKAVTNVNPSRTYKVDLNHFFDYNAKTIKKLPFSAEQVKYMNNYINLIETSIIFPTGALERAEGDADEFFAIFKAVAVPNPSRAYKKALAKFFLKKAKIIFSLGLSTEQIQYMDRYIDSPKVSSKILEDSLRKNCAVSVAALLSLRILPENNE